MKSGRSVRRAVEEYLIDHVLIAETDDVVEVSLGILRVTARVRTSENGHCSARTEDITQRVCSLRSLRESADENDVDILRQFIDEILKAGVSDKCDMMSLLFAPHSNDLGHDAGKIGVHHAGEQRPGRSLGDEVDYSNVKFADILSSLSPGSLSARAIKQ